MIGEKDRPFHFGKHFYQRIARLQVCLRRDLGKRIVEEYHQLDQAGSLDQYLQPAPVIIRQLFDQFQQPAQTQSKQDGQHGVSGQ